MNKLQNQIGNKPFCKLSLLTPSSCTAVSKMMFLSMLHVSDVLRQLRKRLTTAEKEKLDIASRANKEVSGNLICIAFQQFA